MHRPIIYGAPAHAWLEELSGRAGKPLTLAQVPDVELDRLKTLGFDWLWLIGVWQVGPFGRHFAVMQPDLRRACRKMLPDLHPGDLVGSPYAVHDYRVHDALGGDAALASLRKKLARRGMRLMLDFVPNHTACDHPWVVEHPERYLQGTLDDLDAQKAFFAEARAGDALIAHGRDPYFAPWADTAQLDWRNPETVEAMAAQMARLAQMCDGLRCDMAMLVLREVFAKTWGRGLRAPLTEEPWTTAIRAARAKAPDLLLLAEVYWGLERTLIELGFDFVYDKVLYDRLRHDEGHAVRDHLHGLGALQSRSLRFLENHDEERAAKAFPIDRHRAAALVVATLPGPLFVHHGELEGREVKLPIQLRRAPREDPHDGIAAMYREVLAISREAPGGDWRLLPAGPAWQGSHTHRGVVAWAWSQGEKLRQLVTINYAPAPGHALVGLGTLGLPRGPLVLRDRLDGRLYPRAGAELRAKGLYVELPAFGAHVFEPG